MIFLQLLTVKYLREKIKHYEHHKFLMKLIFFVQKLVFQYLESASK